MISRGEVAKLANRFSVGQRVIEKDYVLSWLLVAIAESELRSEVAFKGGTALKRSYFPDYRYSEDLDFTLQFDLPHGELVKAFEALLPSLRQRVNLICTLQSDEQSVFESTKLLVNYVGPLLASLGSRRLSLDFTRGELLLYELAEPPVQASYTDYPTGVTVPTYTLEEILTEKLVALVGRREPRDLYDVYWLFEWGDVDLAFVPHNFAKKCEHKGRDPSRLSEVLSQSEATFRRLWAVRLTHQVPDLPDFDRVVQVVRRHLRALELV
jgi:predicted nucleotidyltransferase component of viral defense system